MKKRFQILAVILCLSLLGCGCTKTKTNDGEPLDTTINTTGKEENENQNKLDVLEPNAYGSVEGLTLAPGSTISIIGRYDGDSYWNEVKAGAQRAVDDINSMLGYKGKDKVTLSYIAPSTRDSVDEQVSLLDEELDRYPVAVGIALVDASAFTVQFDLAAENGIPIVTIDSGSDYDDIASHIATNNILAAQDAANQFAAMLEGSGEIAVFVQDSHSQTAEEREKGFVDTIKDKYPEISIVNIYHMDQLATVAGAIAAEKNAALAEGETAIDAASLTHKDVMKYILEKYPNLKGIYATNLDTTQFVAKELASQKRTDLSLVGFDGGEEQMQLLEDEIVNGLIIQNPYGMGYATVVAAARSVLDQGNEAYVDSGHTWVTKENRKEDSIAKMLY